MNCTDNIIKTKAELKKYINAVKTGNVKRKSKAADALNTKFATHDTTPMMIINLFTDKNGINQAKRENILSDSEEQLTIKDIVSAGKSIVPSSWKKIRGLRNISVENMSIFNSGIKHSNDMTTALNVIQKGIAFSHLTGSVKTEYDLMNKYNLSTEEHSQIMSPGEIIPAVSANGIFSAIGREILATQEIVLSPKPGADRKQLQFEVEKVYADIGAKAVALLEKDGFVTKETPDGLFQPKVINRDFKDSNGDKYSQSRIIPGIAIRFNMEKMLGIDSVDNISDADKRLVEKFFRKQTSSYENTEIQSRFPELYSNVKGSTYLRRLVVPSNSIAPETKYSKNDRKNDDIPVSSRTKETLAMKEQGQLVIPDDIAAMVDFIYDKMESEKISFEDAAKSLGINEYKEMMGYSDETDSSSATRDSNMGKSLSKTTPLSEFFDNYTSVAHLPIHLREEIKRNGRGHYMTTFLNPQTDKFFSRYIMQIPEYEIPAFNKDGSVTDVFNHMVAGIQDQAGKEITIEMIMNSGVNDNLDKLIASFGATNKTDGASIFRYISRAFKKYPSGLSGSVWQKYDTIRAIYNVREAIANAEKGKESGFKGTFMPKPDGKTSGAVIMAMQMAGKNFKNASLFEALGLHGGKAKHEDAYGIMLSVISDTAKKEKGQTLESEVTDVLDFFQSSKIFNNLRDIAKETTMPIMYSQGKNSSKATVAKKFVDKTYRHLESHKRDYVVANKIKSWIKESNPEFYSTIEKLEKKELVDVLLGGEYSRTVYDSMLNYMEPNVAEPLYYTAQNAFVKEYLSGYRERTTSIFKEMERLYKDKTHRITVITPEKYFAAILDKNDGSFDIKNFKPLDSNDLKELKNDKANGIPLVKLFEMVQNPEKNATVSRWEFPHEINANVNLIHAIDFAILNEAFRRTFDEANTNSKAKKGAMANLDLVKNGTISIHDAISAHPEFSMAYQNHYAEAARDINAVYDIHEMMSFELTQMSGYNEKQQGHFFNDSVKERESKTNVLSQMNFDPRKKTGTETSNVFGFDKQDVGVIPYGQEVNTVKQQNEAEVENKKEEEEFNNSQMLTSYISVSEGQESHAAVTELINSGVKYATLDTETVGILDDGSDAMIGGNLKPSMPFQVAFTVTDTDGSTEDHVFYFTNRTIHDDVIKLTGMSNADIEKLNDGKSDKETFDEMKKVLGRMPINGFNAKYDLSALDLLYKEFGDKHDQHSQAVYDTAGAIAYQQYIDKVPTVGQGNKLTDVYKRLFPEGKYIDDNAHSADVDVGMTMELNFKLKSEKKKLVLGSGKKSKGKKNYNIKGKTFEEIVSDLSKEDDEIAKFFENKDVSETVDLGKSWVYDPELHKILISKKSANMQDMIEAMKHEIAHYKAAGFTYIYWDNDTDIKYLRDSLEYLRRNESVLSARLSSDANSRLGYILQKHSKKKKVNEMIAINELIAIMGTETDIANEIVDAINNKTLAKGFKAKLHRLLKKVLEAFNDDAKKIITAAQDAISKGEISGLVWKDSLAVSLGMDKQAYANDKGQKSSLSEALKYNKKADTSYVSGDPLSKFLEESNSFVADLLWTHLGANAEGLVKQGAKAVDAYLEDVSPVYVDVRDSILKTWDGETMSGIKTYLAPSLIKQRKTFDKMKRVFQDANQQHGKVTSTEVTKLDNMLKGMSKEDVARVNSMFAHAPIFGIIKHEGLVHNIANGNMTIDEAISTIERTARNSDIEVAKDFANLYIDGNATGDMYNLYQKGTTARAIAPTEQLTALYSLKKIDGSQNAIRDLYNNNRTLYNTLIEKSRALEWTTIKAYEETGDARQFKGNMALEYYEDPVELKTVSKKDIMNGTFKVGMDWKTLISPEDNHGYAVMYRTGGESQFQEGFGTNIDYGQTDVYMPKEFTPKGANTNGLVSFGTGKTKSYKVVIPMKKKREIGLIENPAHTLLRSYAHIEKVRQTQSIRDEIMSGSGLRMRIDSNEDVDIADLLKKTKERGKDEPWFIDMDYGVDYTKLPEEIQNRFKPIQTKMSSVGGFRQKVSLVRTDIAPWMVGYKRALPFEDIAQLRKISQLVTQAISLMKIHMIIVNPAKVTLDMISTTTLLVSNGVSPLTIARGWKRNISLMNSMSKLKGQQVDLTIRARGGNKTAENKLKEVQDKLRDHPLAGAFNAGIMQSLTTDIITQDYDTITGLQRNIEKFFNRLTHDKIGNENAIHKAVVAFSTAGLNIEDLFAWIGDAGMSTDNFKYAAEEIAIMGKRIEKIKNDKDVAKYLSEFFASPSSTLTRLGSVATTYPDAMSRVIYRDYLIANWARIAPSRIKSLMKNGTIKDDVGNKMIANAKNIKKESDMNDDEIFVLNSLVSDFMPDYAYHPPMILDATGRFFIMPFVSFSARIQRVILNLAERNPLTFFGTLIVTEMMGLEPGETPYHVVGANYITREEFINNVFTDLVSLQTPIPVNTFNFDIIK